MLHNITVHHTYYQQEVEFFVFIMYSQKCININTTLDALCALQSQYKDNHMVGPSLGKEGKAP